MQKLSLIDIQLEETKPMQIQRVLDEIKCPLISLKRMEYGPVKLGTLRKGDWRELKAAEVEKLKLACQHVNKNKDITGSLAAIADGDINSEIDEEINVRAKLTQMSKPVTKPGTGYLRKTTKFNFNNDSPKGVRGTAVGQTRKTGVNSGYTGKK